MTSNSLSLIQIINLLHCQRSKKHSKSGYIEATQESIVRAILSAHQILEESLKSPNSGAGPYQRSLRKVFLSAVA